MRTIPIIDATAPDVVAGRHALWCPREQIKVPFQFGGLVTKYRHAEAGYLPSETIPNELAIMRALAAERMAPPIGEIVRVETLISNHPGAWHADPLGAWGYEMGDATKLPPGRFSIERMKALPIEGSPGAWNDILVADRANIINGYLVDVRRSAFDMLRWTDGGLEALPVIAQDTDSLRARVHRDSQFPAGQRAEAYQDFWLAGNLERGQRRIVERAQAMGFAPEPNETVLDIGCQAGGFLQYAAMRGVKRLAGVEIDAKYVDCSRALAWSCGQNISVRQMDVIAERAAFLEWVRDYFPNGVDHLLLLSMEKHLGEHAMFALIDAIGAERTYIETNAVGIDAGTMKLWPHVQTRGGRHVGDSTDRNLRRLYQIGAP
jgi:hypothetical protein